MNVVVTSEHHFDRTPDGQVWTDGQLPMDVINDLNGSYVCTFIRRKIRMWAGQTDQALTVRDDRLELIGQLIGEKLGHFGILDCDLFVTERGCYVVDINPRIGGGYHSPTLPAPIFRLR